MNFTEATSFSERFDDVTNFPESLEIEDDMLGCLLDILKSSSLLSGLGFSELSKNQMISIFASDFKILGSVVTIDNDITIDVSQLFSYSTDQFLIDFPSIDDRISVVDFLFYFVSTLNKLTASPLSYFKISSIVVSCVENS
ncbi:hypothetical protein GEMRC1_013474 [Eukaryota sp. GEM-RC1]